jgi:hypothetical protein
MSALCRSVFSGCCLATCIAVEVNSPHLSRLPLAVETRLIRRKISESCCSVSVTHLQVVARDVTDVSCLHTFALEQKRNVCLGLKWIFGRHVFRDSPRNTATGVYLLHIQFRFSKTVIISLQFSHSTQIYVIFCYMFFICKHIWKQRFRYYLDI